MKDFNWNTQKRSGISHLSLDMQDNSSKRCFRYRLCINPWVLKNPWDSRNSAILDVYPECASTSSDYEAPTIVPYYVGLFCQALLPDSVPALSSGPP